VRAPSWPGPSGSRIILILFGPTAFPASADPCRWA
jgi:hypothetical protein